MVVGHLPLEWLVEPLGSRMSAHGQSEGAVQNPLTLLQLLRWERHGGDALSFVTIRAWQQMNQTPQLVRKDPACSGVRMFHEIATDLVLVVAEPVRMNAARLKKDPRVLEAARREYDDPGAHDAMPATKIPDLDRFDGCTIRAGADIKHRGVSARSKRTPDRSVLVRPFRRDEWDGISHAPTH